MKPVVIEKPVGDDPPSAELYYGGDVIDTLRLLPDGYVQTVCTSPPYWGLRDYGSEGLPWGGDPDCEHVWGEAKFCTQCEAWLGQLGLEPTPELYCQHMVGVFKEVARVLRPDGTLWLNLGDSYHNLRTHKGGGAPTNTVHVGGSRDGIEDFCRPNRGLRQEGVKEKDLVGIPWMVAFALRSAGWYLRSDIIWSKNNPMPESVRDRPTKAHEYIFLFAHPDSGGRYYYDTEAIREPLTGGASPGKNQRHEGARPGGRNRRTVWNINTKPFPGAHFAVWPEKLVVPMIKAGTSQEGGCPACGSPWVRILKTSGGRDWREDKMMDKGIPGALSGEGSYKRGQSSSPLNDVRKRETTGWEPSCECPKHQPLRQKVLDPFSGSGTTGLVALDLGRDYVGIDLNQEYLPLAEKRLRKIKGVRAQKTDPTPSSILDLFN